MTQQPTGRLFGQHARPKSQYPGAILLMRVGDSCEAFDEDADTLARVLSIAKTTRGQHRVAGFPLVQLGRFLTALVGADFRVATAEPGLNKPLPGKPATIRRRPDAQDTPACAPVTAAAVVPSLTVVAVALPARTSV